MPHARVARGTIESDKPSAAWCRDGRRTRPEVRTRRIRKVGYVNRWSVGRINQTQQFVLARHPPVVIAAQSSTSHCLGKADAVACGIDFGLGRCRPGTTCPLLLLSRIVVVGVACIQVAQTAVSGLHFPNQTSRIVARAGPTARVTSECNAVGQIRPAVGYLCVTAGRSGGNRKRHRHAARTASVGRSDRHGERATGRRPA
ncbi:hypothetical protein GALL_444110 [mine drainage metagenome]|uniref:Uncharacterized protein n=1 Tax=mine drainage metagenome TaxID=410659 RepID=A0A1J5Q8Y8_9ZZZZ